MSKRIKNFQQFNESHEDGPRDFDGEQDFNVHHNDLEQFETEYATYNKNEEDEWSIVLKYDGQEFGPSFEHPEMDSWDTVSPEDERKLKEVRSTVATMLKENNLTDLKNYLNTLPVDQLFGAATHDGWDWESFDENPETAVAVVATLVIAKIDLFFKITMPY